MYIEQLRRNIDNFDLIYKNELKHLDITLRYQYALSDWMAGKNKLARRKLNEIIFLRKKYCIVFLFTFFPFGFFQKLMKILKIRSY